MLQFINLSNVLFLDIECVSGFKTYDHQPEALQACWDIKSTQIQRGVSEDDLMSPDQSYPERAAIYCEFGKIICISVGLVRYDKNNQPTLHVKSFYGHDERELLTEFSQLLDQYFNDPLKHYICGHNIKEFDIPYICRRMIINGLSFPKLLDIAGKKPWETKHLLDTLELWKFGDNKNFTSLKLLCAVFGIPTPKDDIDGADVGRVYWEENDVERIERYCKKDVIATAQLFMKLRLQDFISDDRVFLK